MYMNINAYMQTIYDMLCGVWRWTNQNDLPSSEEIMERWNQEPVVIVNRGDARRSLGREHQAIVNRVVVAVVNEKSCPVQTSRAARILDPGSWIQDLGSKIQHPGSSNLDQGS